MAKSESVDSFHRDENGQEAPLSYERNPWTSESEQLGQSLRQDQDFKIWKSIGKGIVKTQIISQYC